MSIASLFKPVDSSKTRLPRTDVLERVAKYADGKSVVSNYFDISTPELVQMLRSDLVPAPEVEYVTNIVRGRLSGEVGEAPKKSVGEAIKTTPIKKFTVSDPTKDFITPESVRDIVKGFIDASSAPTGFERGNYLESLIDSGTSGGPTQRGSSAKDKAYLDPLNVRSTSLLASKEPSNNPNYQRGTGSDGDFGSGFHSVSKDTQRGTDSEGNFGSGFSTPQSEIDAYNSKILQEKFNRERAATNGFFSNESNPLAATDQKATSSAMSPPISENFAANMAKRDEAGGFGISDIFKKQGVAGVAKDVGSKAVTVGKDLYEALSRPVVTDRKEMLTAGAPMELPTRIALGEEGVQQLRKTTAGDATTARMAGREAGIAALPSDVGTAAAEGTRGIVPGGAQQQAYDTQRGGVAPGGELQQAYDTQRGAAPAPAPAPSATPTTDYRAAPDKPTKDDKKAIQETATAVAKNPSVGGIQSLFEQAGFSDALLQLGLGMMASKNPDFLGALGEAGQGAVALMAKQREEAKKAKLEADKLELEKQRNAIYGRSVDESGKTDKRPAIVQTSEAYSTAIKTAKEQEKNKLFDTTEQFIARDYASKQIVPAAQEAAQRAATAWDKIHQDLPSSKKKEYEEKNPKDVYVSKAYQASLQQNPELYKLLNIGVPTTDAVDLKSQYNLQLK